MSDNTDPDSIWIERSASDTMPIASPPSPREPTDVLLERISAAHLLHVLPWMRTVSSPSRHYSFGSGAVTLELCPARDPAADRLFIGVGERLEEAPETLRNSSDGSIVGGPALSRRPA